MTKYSILTQCIILFWCRRTNKGIKYPRLLQLRVGRSRSKNCVASICSQNYQFLYTHPPFFFYKMKYTFYIAKKNVFTDARPLGNKRIINKNCYRSFWSHNLVKLKKQQQHCIGINIYITPYREPKVASRPPAL